MVEASWIFVAHGDCGCCLLGTQATLEDLKATLAENFPNKSLYGIFDFNARHDGRIIQKAFFLYWSVTLTSLYLSVFLSVSFSFFFFVCVCVRVCRPWPCFTPVHTLKHNHTQEPRWRLSQREGQVRNYQGGYCWVLPLLCQPGTNHRPF